MKSCKIIKRDFTVSYFGKSSQHWGLLLSLLILIFAGYFVFPYILNKLIIRRIEYIKQNNESSFYTKQDIYENN